MVPRGTYVDQLSVVTLLQVMQHRGIVKVCQVGHILGFLVFRGIDLGQLVFLEVLGLLFFIVFVWVCVGFVRILRSNVRGCRLVW